MNTPDDVGDNTINRLFEMEQDMNIAREDNSDAWAHQLEMENRRREEQETREMWDAIRSRDPVKLAALLYKTSPFDWQSEQRKDEEELAKQGKTLWSDK